MKKLTTVLLVEDDENDRFFFIECLRHIPNAVIYDVAINGREAMEQLLNAEVLPDLIVTDINMPLMDGIQLLTEIKDNPQTKDIPIVFLSSDVQQTERTRQLGARGFVAKPNDILTLRTQLKKVMSFDFANEPLVAFMTL